MKEQSNWLLFILPFTSSQVSCLQVHLNSRKSYTTNALYSAGKCYYSILMEYPKQIRSITIDHSNSIGLDMSLPKLYVDSNGVSPDFPKPYRTVESLIAKIQRRMSNKRRGSANHEKERQRELYYRKSPLFFRQIIVL